MNERLIVDCVGYAELCLNESANGSVKFRGKFQEANTINKNRRKYPRKILEHGVNNLMEQIENRGLFGELDHPCLIDPNFRVFTPNGWKEFREIRVGDIVYSRKNGKMVESKVNAIVDKPYEGVVHNFKGKSIDCTFTPNHKFLFVNRNGQEEYAKTKEIISEPIKFAHSYIPKTARWEGNEQKLFVIPGVEKTRNPEYSKPLVMESKVFAGFLGIYLAEGNITKRKYRIVISQKTEYGCELVKEILDQTGLKWKKIDKGFAVHDARLYNYLAPIGNKYTKYIPKEIKNLSSDCLESLLFWFTIGDGRILKKNEDNTTRNYKIDLIESDNRLMDCGKYSRLSMFSVSKDLISDLSECLVKCGYCSVVSTHFNKDRLIEGRLIKASNTKPLYNINVSRSKGIHLDPRFLKTTTEYYNGRIYCLTTEHGNFYMEYKGKSFWTGNCDSIVHLANASHLITKLWWENDCLMGEGEILNTPSGKILKSMVDSGIRFGMSSRGVGSGQNDADGVLVIGENFKLITFDAVADPSTPKAFQSKYKESVIPQEQPKPKFNTKALISYFDLKLQEKLNESKKN